MAMKTQAIDLIFNIMEDYSGQEVPKIEDLKRQYNTSYPTVRRALDILKRRKYVINGVVEGVFMRGGSPM